MNLGANAVVFFLHAEGPGRFAKKVVGLLHGRRQHEADGMKQGDRRGLEFIGCRQAQGLADIAGKHVSAAHRRQGALESFGDRLLDEIFSQTNPQVPRNDFDDVLHIVRARLAHQAFQRVGFLCLSAHAGELIKTADDT